MPRYDQIVNEPDGTPIKPSERVYVRSILGITQDVDFDDYNASETRFDEISKRQPDVTADKEQANIFICKAVRVLYKKYGKLSDDTTALKGGSEGVDYSADRNRTRIALQLQNIIVPVVQPIPLEPIPAEVIDNTNTSSIISVPVRYGEWQDTGDEYSS